jgi:hypothetical protein
VHTYSLIDVGGIFVLHGLLSCIAFIIGLWDLYDRRMQPASMDGTDDELQRKERISVEHAQKVLELTHDVSTKLKVFIFEPRQTPTFEC